MYHIVVTQMEQLFRVMTKNAELREKLRLNGKPALALSRAPLGEVISSVSWFLHVQKRGDIIIIINNTYCIALNVPL